MNDKEEGWWWSKLVVQESGEVKRDKILFSSRLVMLGSKICMGLQQR